MAPAAGSRRSPAGQPAVSPPARSRGRFDAPLTAWFTARGWRVAPFQRQAWRHYLTGGSGLLVTPTGSGKTLAAFGGPLLEALAALPSSASVEAGADGDGADAAHPAGTGAGDAGAAAASRGGDGRGQGRLRSALGARVP